MLALLCASVLVRNINTGEMNDDSYCPVRASWRGCQPGRGLMLALLCASVLVGNANTREMISVFVLSSASELAGTPTREGFDVGMALRERGGEKQQHGRNELLWTWGLIVLRERVGGDVNPGETLQ